MSYIFLEVLSHNLKLPVLLDLKMSIRMKCFKHLKLLVVILILEVVFMLNAVGTHIYLIIFKAYLTSRLQNNRFTEHVFLFS